MGERWVPRGPARAAFIALKCSAYTMGGAVTTYEDRQFNSDSTTWGPPPQRDPWAQVPTQPAATPQQGHPWPAQPMGYPDPRIYPGFQEGNRTENAALTALVLSLIGLFMFFPLGIAALIVCHWAARGGKRTWAMVLSWFQLIAGTAVLITVIALAVSASNSYNNYTTSYNTNSAYQACMDDPDTTYSQCQSLR
jgi:hypothetical protein